MVWEWVSPVATAGAGGLGVLFTWLSGKQGRDHAETVTNQQLTHARQLAYDTRKQQRLESAYVALLDMTERGGHWAHSAYPIVDTNPPREVPPLPSLDEQAHVKALLSAFGSRVVADHLNVWISVIQDLLVAGEKIQLFRERTLAREPGESHPYKVFHSELRPRETKARKAIATQVALELSAKPW